MKKTLILLSLFILLGCSENNNQVKVKGYKYYPFKSAALIYEQEDNDTLYREVKIWDDWGKKHYYRRELQNKKSVKNPPRRYITQLIKDASILYTFEHYKKVIKQRREFIRFLQILSEQDLRKYYLDNTNAMTYTEKTDGKAVVGGVECNIWEGRWVRACRYKDIVTLKEEKKSLNTNEWVTVKEVTSAQFNEPIEQKIFDLPKDYKIEVSSTFKTEEELEKYVSSPNAKRDINMSIDIVKDNYRKIMNARKSYFDMFKRKEEK